MFPLTTIESADLAENVLVVGDPARARTVAKLLTDARPVAANREYHTYTGTFDGVAISVTSHGVGAAGAGAAFTELCRAGARRIIRVGTCGGMQPQVQTGDVVVATGAVRDDGLSERLVPLGYPALCDARLQLALAEYAGPQAHTGIVLTSDLFYPIALPGHLPLWARAGVIAVEMELSALLVIASLHGVAAGGLLIVDGNPLAEADEQMTSYNPHTSVVADATARAIRVALDTLAHLG